MQTEKEIAQRIARLQMEAARLQTELKAQQRKADAKRKILMGAGAMSLAADDAVFAAALKDHLHKTVRRASDRELLGLEVLPGKTGA